MDKTWNGIHYLLSKKSLAETEMEGGMGGIIGNTIFSNQIIDEEQDFDYGPAFYNDSQLVKGISHELNKPTAGRLL